MMHEPEKSDPSIVAVKPASNSKGLEAESVPGRITAARDGVPQNSGKEISHRLGRIRTMLVRQ